MLVARARMRPSGDFNGFLKSRHTMPPSRRPSAAMQPIIPSAENRHVTLAQSFSSLRHEGRRILRITLPRFTGIPEGSI